MVARGGHSESRTLDTDVQHLLARATEAERLLLRQHEAVALLGGNHPLAARLVREDVDDIGLVIQIEHQAQRLTVAARRRQLVARQGEEPTVRGEDQQLVGSLSWDHEAVLVALFVFQFGRIFDPALGGANPATIAEDHGDRLANDHRLDGRVGINSGSHLEGRAPLADPRVGTQDCADILEAHAHQLPLLAVGGQHRHQPIALLGHFGMFATQFHLLQPRQLA